MNGAVFYNGPSQLPGQEHVPIIGLLVGLDTKSRNPKTGDMLQTYILVRDTNPIVANQQNTDHAICGDCRMRGQDGVDRGCYVPLKWAPYGVWKAYHRGSYMDEVPYSSLQGRELRMGTYGDPAAIPFDAWGPLLRAVGGWTGYTHQWRTADPWFRRTCMASVDSEAEMHEAQAMGWRTYRARATDQHPVLEEEVVCPASAEAGHRSTCEVCQLCRGTSNAAKSVVIVVHGQNAKHAITHPLNFIHG